MHITKLWNYLLILNVKNDIKTYKFDKMNCRDENSLKYLTMCSDDWKWGLVTTTVGMQSIAPNASYPAMQHPATYDLKPQVGRVLDEYQMVYITEGSGFFESESMPRQRVETGTVILLFPGEWHNYAPDVNCGWQEYWIGFQGANMDMLVNSGFYSRDEALMVVGVSNSVIALYKDAIRLANKESIGCQQMISGVVMHLLSLVYYRYRNRNAGANRVEDIINDARQLMRERIHHSLRVEDIAASLGVGYSWFRQTFRRVTGISPSQYLNRLLMSRAKELLVSDNQSITELAYALGFETVGQFSTAFRKMEGTTPRRFREENKLRGFYSSEMFRG